MKVLTNGEWLGRAECPYARRWILDLGICSLRVHQWLHSDDPRYLHDHPWWFVTIVVSGGYTDVSDPSGNDERVYDHLGRWSIRFRPALHRHYVQPDPRGCWSVLLTGKAKRRWGFWVKGRFRKSSRFFFDHGHPPCD